MEPVNKARKRRRGRLKNRTPSGGAQADGVMFPAVAGGGSPEETGVWMNRPKTLTALHMACLIGQLDTIRFLVESTPECIDSADPEGRRPIHMVMSSQSSPNTSACLRYLLENGADVNVTTDSGQTPLHLAASEGFMDCSEILVQAGADVLAKDGMGHTPLDMTRIWCRRKVARYLKSCMWKAEKKKEMEERKEAQALYTDLVDMFRLYKLRRRPLIDESINEWEEKKGLPHIKDFTPTILASQYHTHCLSSNQANKHAKGLCKHQPRCPLEDHRRPPTASASRPWTIYTGLPPEKPPAVPDLRETVRLWRDGRSRQPQYSTKWESRPRAAPDLPMDALERALFPRAFPSRIPSPRHFEPQDIAEVQQLRRPQDRSTSPWTEVAMHLVEVLEPGHYWEEEEEVEPDVKSVDSC